MKTFQIGKTYTMHSLCNWDCTWSYKVIARTACTITLADEDGNVKNCRIDKRRAQYFGEESVKPLGNYSMSPTLRA